MFAALFSAVLFEVLKTVHAHACTYSVFSNCGRNREQWTRKAGWQVLNTGAIYDLCERQVVRFMRTTGTTTDQTWTATNVTAGFILTTVVNN